MTVSVAISLTVTLIITPLLIYLLIQPRVTDYICCCPMWLASGMIPVGEFVNNMGKLVCRKLFQRVLRIHG